MKLELNWANGLLEKYVNILIGLKDLSIDEMVGA